MTSPERIVAPVVTAKRAVNMRDLRLRRELTTIFR
jgi:hypothetical protein